ncbi:Non-specific serine/threonine protein kinase protein [Dioscorea alata]|uniref:Non-specific serine/threonine protein kinase protein n=1 Tax=Dioscorea alata TaxID=55571 RepID=A0ACB7UVV3_DIOAL|nr:Non-specific serine/threonine protein kinase protein [Dioscorea alata]
MLLRVFLIWAILLKIALSDGNDFTYNGFKGVNLSLDGLAGITSDGLLSVTNTTKHQHDKGHAFFPVPLRFKRSQADNVGSFTTTFVFAIFPEHPMAGGAGFAIVLSPSKDLTQASPYYFLGVFNKTNNGNASNHILAIEFDTWYSPEAKDINGNQVGIDINGCISNKSAPAGFHSDDDGKIQDLVLLSDQPMQVRIEYNGTDMQLNVTLAPLWTPKPRIPLLSSTINLSSIILDLMYVGFSASVGASYSHHYILGWSFNMDGKAPELNLSSLPPLPQNLTSFEKKSQNNLSLWLPPVLSVLVLLIAAGATALVVRKKKFSELHDDWELDFESNRFSYVQLYKATRGFKDECLLGIGGFGKVYRGVLPACKMEVAVKRVSHESKQGVREFMGEIVSLGKLRHRNLVQLLGYCRRKGELLLVYDYMPNGSLDGYLFSQGKKILDWNLRFQIIKGVASGLQYLHEGWDKVVIHRDIKASNVLLDSEMNGRLGDFGLARLYDHGAAPQTTNVVGTLGFLAPELAKPGGSGRSISSTVYHHLNQKSPVSDNWIGWKLLWSISVAPRLKHFIWLCLKGRLSTTNFIYSLHLGPDSPCSLCGLARETIDHLFGQCPKSLLVWEHLSIYVNFNIYFPDGFSSGTWLSCSNYSPFTLAVIVAGAWFIWKARCDVIFNNISMNCMLIANRSVAHVNDNFLSNCCLLGRRLILNNFTSADDHYLFTHAVRSEAGQVLAFGFFLANTNFHVSFAGCCAQPTNDNSSVVLSALEVALRIAMEFHLPVKHLFCVQHHDLYLLHNSDPVICWHLHTQISNVRFLLDMNSFINIHNVPPDWMTPAAMLASHGLLHQTLNLFLFGKDLPHWIMKAFLKFGFVF